MQLNLYLCFNSNLGNGCTAPNGKYSTVHKQQPPSVTLLSHEGRNTIDMRGLKIYLIKDLLGTAKI